MILSCFSYIYKDYQITKVRFHTTSENGWDPSPLPVEAYPSQEIFINNIIKNFTNKKFQVHHAYDFLLRDWVELCHETYKGTPEEEVDAYPIPLDIEDLFTKMFKDAGNVIRKVMDDQETSL